MNHFEPDENSPAPHNAAVQISPPPHIQEVLDEFAIARERRVEDFNGKGNIHNDSYLVTAGGCEYILQRINDVVFTQPWNVMDAMVAAIEAQRAFPLHSGIPQDLDWHTIELVPAKGGELYTSYTQGPARGYWRLMVRIPSCVTYKSLSQVEDMSGRLRLAEEAGRGMAVFTSLAAAIDPARIVPPLPGYRNTHLYYSEFRSVLAGSRTVQEAERWLPQDEELRQNTCHHFYLADPEYARRKNEPDLQPFIDLAARSAEFALTIQRGLENGAIRTTAVHGDTKLENFLFCARTGRVKALVDLDTIMPHTWLSDWGDMVRSFVNVAGEKEPDLDRVRIDCHIFRAVARGFLSTVAQVPAHELALMVDAIRIITLELGVRFLTDYLRGDNYFVLEDGAPRDLNRIRACVQLRLFEHLSTHRHELAEIVSEMRR